MKDDSSLAVTPFSIPSSATQGLDVDLSFDKGFEEVLEDSKDKLFMKTRVSNFDEDSDGGEQEAETISICLLFLVNLLCLFFLSFLGTTL